MLMYHAQRNGESLKIYHGCRVVMVVDKNIDYQDLLFKWNDRIKKGKLDRCNLKDKMALTEA